MLGDCYIAFYRGRKLDRNYPRPYDEVASGGNPRFNRSISDNWRDKGAGDDDEEGDWRKAGRDKWSKIVYCGVSRWLQISIS